MNKAAHVDFGAEVARILPAILREVARTQKSVLTKGNLAMSHIVVLELLKTRGSCTMGELAKALNFTMSAATGMVDKMIEMGLVKRERSEKDRRVGRVVLLKKGEKMAGRVNEARRKIANNIYSVLTQKEKQAEIR